MKYYVSSGDLKQMVIAESAIEAAKKSIQQLNGGETLDLMFYVDERGFRGPGDYHLESMEDFDPDTFFSQHLFDYEDVVGEDVFVDDEFNDTY